MRVSRGGFLSPAVRRLLAEHGLEPSDVVGTGAGGRITRHDVEEEVQFRSGKPGAEPPPAPDARVEAPPPEDAAVEPAAAPSLEDAPTETMAAAPAEAVEPAAPAEPEPTLEADEADEPPLVVDWDKEEEEPAPPPRREPATTAPEDEPAPASSPQVESEARQTLVPFTPMRRRIAENLKASRATAAHAFCAVEADFERVERVRHAQRDAWREQEGFSLTYLPFVARAAIAALAEFPHLNASVVDDGLLVHHDVHLGIAVDLEFEGLIVPVIRDAAAKTLRDLGREVSQLAERARGGRLRPDDVASGTFTITNPGPSGTLLSVPIINQPQVAILATDTVRRRPVMVPTGDGGEGIAIHAVGNLGLSFDHRAVDGLYATSFLTRVKKILETSDWDAELALGGDPSR
jgi:pyruvate dehydrogenase E2 component (dihydrolipoamide acetyltransferase)